ncbi:hypothetical protein [Clostridium sp.]|uniref:hypothetical protein n=1 Tax=Clostridium sp. TaxID=1506 RepID=UPI003523083F
MEIWDIVREICGFTISLISLDEGKRFINDGNGIVRIKEAFKGKRKVRLINSTLEDCFKVILPMKHWNNKIYKANNNFKEG